MPKNSPITIFTNGTYHLVRKGYDINIRNMAVLLAVYSREEPYTVRALAEFLEVNKPTVTRSLDALEKSPTLIERLDDPTDRRSVLIGKTAAGQDFLYKFQEALKGNSDIDVIPLNEEEQPIDFADFSD